MPLKFVDKIDDGEEIGGATLDWWFKISIKRTDHISIVFRGIQTEKNDIPFS